MIKISQIDLNVYISFFEHPKANSSIRKNRLQYFAELVMNLSQIDVNTLKVKVFINRAIRNLDFALEPLASRTGITLIDVVEVPHYELVNKFEKYEPHLLTWAHKKQLRSDVLSGGEKSYYLYLEDDAIFTQGNLEYFLSHREKLRKHGLIPSYMRSEWSRIHDIWVNSDAMDTLSNRTKATLGLTQDVYYADLENPYCALSLFDHELAQEYLNSESSDLDLARGKHKIICDTAASAALGLICENIPEGFHSRTVVAFNAESNQPIPNAIVRHQGDRYANDVWWLQYPLFDHDVKLPKPTRTLYQKSKRLLQITKNSIKSF
jgi:hypothetical protein